MAEKRSAKTVAKDIALFFASPFIALAYLVLFPFIAIKVWKRLWSKDDLQASS